MKTYKSVEQFIEMQKDEINWEDYMTIGGKKYKIYEYGGGSIMRMDYDYVYFVNKRTHDAIFIKYICPAFQWKGGKQVQTAFYRFIDAEFYENMDLWRTDTL